MKLKFTGSLLIVCWYIFFNSTALLPQQLSSGQRIAEGYLPGAEETRLYYRIYGTKSDTIVAIHGGPGAGMNAILPDLKPLAKNHTVIFYDQRGGGRSELPADTAKLDARFFIADLEAVRQHFNLKRMAIVAHSFGSVLLASYLQKYPDRVKRMVFLGATGPLRAEAAKLAMRKYAEMDSTTMQRLGSILGPLMSGTAADPVAACQQYETLMDELAAARGEPNNWRGSTCNAPSEAIKYYYRYTARIAPESFGQWDFTQSLKQIKTPLLVIYGGMDPLEIAQQRAWADALPNGKLFLVPNSSGKGAIADRPDLVFPAIETFLGGDWPEKVE